MTDYIVHWLWAFSLTCAVEVPLVALWARWRELPISRAAGVAVGAQCVTHPTLWAAFWWAPPEDYGAWLVAAETVVWLTEGMIYAGWLWLEQRDIRRSVEGLGVALTANVATTLLGFIAQ